MAICCLISKIPAMRISNQMWQLIMFGLITNISDKYFFNSIFLTMCGDGTQQVALRLDLLRYWQQLTKAGHNPAEAYVNMVQTAADGTVVPKNQEIEVCEYKLP